MVQKPNASLFGQKLEGRPLPKVKHGVVKCIIYKTNKRGAKQPYVQVLWDHSCCVEISAQSRLVHENEKDQMLSDQVESIGL